MEEYIVTIVKDFIKKCDIPIKQIYLVRHGETDANKNNLSQGSELDLPLNDTGRYQAEKTGEYLRMHLKDRDKDCIILTSPQVRAVETAGIINNRIETEVNKIKELSEISKGRLSGLGESDELSIKVAKTQTEFFEQYNDPLKRGELGIKGFHDFMEDKLKDDSIGFETIESVNHRINKILKLIRTSDSKKIIIVSHSGFLELMIKTMMNLVDSDVSIMIKGNMKNGKNCWISRIDYNPKDDAFRLITAPNTEHLAMKE